VKRLVSSLRDEFDVVVSVSGITRALQSVRWCKKVIRKVAKRRYSLLRHLYHYRAYHLVFIDEFGCDSSISQRRKGWALVGLDPIDVSSSARPGNSSLQHTLKRV
jgi:hypothetical protein